MEPDGQNTLFPRALLVPAKAISLLGERVHCAYTAEMTAMGEEESGPWQGAGEQPA